MVNFSELNAVNDILEGIQTLPVNEITEDDESIFAYNVLQRKKLEVLMTGYSFNTDDNIILTPDINGFIYSPSDMLSFSIKDNYGKIKFVKNRFYDKVNNTYVFTEDLKISKMILDIEFSDLPIEAQSYIMQVARLSFMLTNTGDTALYRNYLVQLDEAKGTLNNSEQRANGFKSTGGYIV